MNGRTAGEFHGTAPVQRQRPPTVLLRVLLTALVATATFFLTSALTEDASWAWPWTASVVTGSAVTIVQYLVAIGHRFETVDRRFNELLAATELFSQVDGSVLRSDEVTRLVLGYTKIRERGGDIAQAFAEKELGRLAKMMEGLGNGSTDDPGENHEWLIDLTDCVKMTLDAVSTSVDRDFWYSGPAERYLAAQEKAIKRRGVEIRRLFVVREPDEVTPELRALVESQGRRGIESRIAVRSLMASNPRVNDFIVFDGELCYETKLDFQSIPDRTWLTADQDHVDDRVSQFAELWAESERGLERQREPEPLSTAGAVGVRERISRAEASGSYPGRTTSSGSPVGSSPTSASASSPDISVSGAVPLPAHLSPCQLLLTLLDDDPTPGTDARIELRVRSGPRHPWSQPGADRPELTAVATPLTPAEIEPGRVSLRPSRSGGDGAAQVVFRAERAGTHRISVTVLDKTTGTVLQRVETTVDVADAPDGNSPAAPSTLITEGE
ncbi:DUF6879 family protein [Streptomyces sp. NPDC049627]|uniref:DUF6879 family protein n=1 Tax=Streptomyces sp. NPDC049627 TaxID=3365595 RepID=UPI0037BC6C97